MRTAKYPAPTRDNPLIIPYSALVLFRKCRKAYELGYEMRIDPGSSEAAQNGTAVHEYLADYARFGSVNPVEPGDLMWDVAMYYVGYRGLPGDNLLVEQPIYTKLLPNVYLRTTLDRVYREPGSGWVVGVDYKTFSKQPTNDFELDPQGGLYIAALMRKLKTDEVKFRYEYIRSVPPGTKNSKGAWAVDECYTTVEVIISKREADLFWSEAQDTARDLIRARREGRFYRGGTRVEFGSPCLGCFYKSLCIAEKNYGELTDDDIAVLAVGIKDPLTLEST
jgi:hypothetical protein